MPPRSGGRQVLIVLAVVLAILVLLCAGVVSFLVHQGNVASWLRGGAAGMAAVSYRHGTALPQLTHLSEGRQTL
jgi:serine/threonine-protein kinase